MKYDQEQEHVYEGIENGQLGIRHWVTQPKPSVTLVLLRQLHLNRVCSGYRQHVCIFLRYIIPK